MGPVDKVTYTGCSNCYSKVVPEDNLFMCNKCQKHVDAVPYYFFRAELLSPNEVTVEVGIARKPAEALI